MGLETGYLLTKDNQRIFYNYHNKGLCRLIIIVHGFYNSSQAVVLADLADKLSADYDVFSFDFRGHGQSSGYFTFTSKEEQDLETVFDFLNKKNYQEKAIIAFSLGASIAINFLSRNPCIDRLISISAVSSFWKIDYNFWKLDFKNDLIYTIFTSQGRKGKGVRLGPFWFKKNRTKDLVSNLSIPVMYIHSLKDWVVGAWHSKLLYERTNSKKSIKLINSNAHAEYILKDKLEEIVADVKMWLE